MTLLLSIFPTVQAVSDKVIAAEISSLNVFFKMLPPLIKCIFITINIIL